MEINYLNTGKYFKLGQFENIAVLTISNPPVNVFEMPLYAELAEFQGIIASWRNIKAIIVNAEGKYFSAGIDLKSLGVIGSEYQFENLQWLQKLYSHWQDINIPVIVAVQGLCIGSGTEFILGCDIRIAAEGTKFSLPEVKFGLSPDMGGTAKLTQLIGIGQAKRMLLTAEEIDADEAYRIGLVEYIVPADKLFDKAVEVARKIVEMPKNAVCLAKKGINLSAEAGVYAGLLFEQAQSFYCCGSEDKTEAINAFLEKRKPSFKE